MGYGWESRYGLLQATDPVVMSGAIAFQTLADKGSWTVLGPVTVLRFGVLLNANVTVTNAVIDFDKRVTFGSDTGRVSKFGGTMTIPFGSTIGQMVYKDVQVDLNPGEQLMVKLATASTAGGGVFYIEWIPRAEMPVNYPHMIRSV